MSAKMPFSRITCYRQVWRMYTSRFLPLSSVHLSGVQRRPLTTDTIPSPTFEGEAKTYAPKIEKLVNEISQLTLVEVADLNELLKKTLKLPDVPSMMYSSAAPARAAVVEEEVEETPVKQEKSLFTVRLLKFDEAKKVPIIKEIKNLIAGMNLVQAKKFVESVPQTVKSEVTKEEAEKLKTTLEAVGAVIEID